jgi:transcriptional regulator with XRE-family HTH domain
MSEILAKKIFEARKAAGMTQAQLADRLGLTRGAVTLWESSNPETRSSPSIAMLRKFSETVGVPIFWLIDESQGKDDLELARQLYQTPVPQGLLGLSPDTSRVGQQQGVAGLLSPSQRERRDGLPEGLLGLVRNEPSAGKLVDSGEGQIGGERDIYGQGETDVSKEGIQRTRITSAVRLDLRSDHPPRMVENFWRSVEFEVCLRRPDLERAFHPSTSGKMLRATVDFLSGENVAEFSYVSEKETLSELFRRKMGVLLTIETAIKRPMRKHLLIWAPTESLAFEDLSGIREAGSYLGAEVQLFKRPSEAADYLTELA